MGGPGRATDPTNPDTDGDGLSDRIEREKYDTLPINTDSDYDGMPDGEEVERGRDPDRRQPVYEFMDWMREVFRNLRT